MAYAIKAGEAIAEALRRIAGEQLESAGADLDSPDDQGGLEEAVHDCRKRCKKLRALVRLIRPALGDYYNPLNTAFRDAGRQLSELRDAQALLAMFDDLVAARADQLPDGGLEGVRAGLQDRADRTSPEAPGADTSGRLKSAAAFLDEGGRLLDKALSALPRDDGAGFELVAGGLGRTYRQGRRALRQAAGTDDDESFHEWRKRAKDSWSHVRLLAPMAPSVLDPLGKRFHDLSDALGDAQNLAVLAGAFRDAPGDFGGTDEVEAALVLVDGSRVDLRDRAVRLGARLYAEGPKRFVARIGTYWAVQQQWGPERPAGEIADIFDTESAVV